MSVDRLFNLGIDIGSTTIKIVLMNENGDIVLTDYRRHNANIKQTEKDVLYYIFDKVGDCKLNIVMTGSVGMGVADKMKWTFVQEVVASAHYVSSCYPEIKTFIDIGGEDSKMIFFDEGKVPDIRMNGSCAGGTGAFIDQVATLLNVETSELNSLAAESETIYPIASRCGVFSKTDIQNLMSRNVGKSDIASSVLNAVAIQVVSSLARGTDILPKVFFCGGPFAFLPQLHYSFQRVLNIKDEDCIIPENAQLVPATGCALIACKNKSNVILLSDLLKSLDNNNQQEVYDGRLKSLFPSEGFMEQWTKTHQHSFLRLSELKKSSVINAFMGVDSGSTTTKLVLLDEKGDIIYHDYRRNNGDSFHTFLNCLKTLQQSAVENNTTVNIVSSAVTGYGENLLKTAFNIDFGIVETMAHFIAARTITPDVSFVLDIGGQDMKAIFVENGSIKRIEINEACSSGCGSFIETFANMLHYPVAEFAKMSCLAKNPCDLGTRCTVFMNSKVKQSLSEGASVDDIAAGFSYSVIKNCLFKVLKLRDVKELGDKIVVQGGTFKNLSVVRALEILTGKVVGFSDIPELMGAFGASLYAKEHALGKSSVTLSEMIESQDYESAIEVCPGCDNHCTVKVFLFCNGAKFFSGNNCEKIYSNRSDNSHKGIDQHQEKYDLLFNRKNISQNEAVMRIGIPRGLGIYENYPFWHALFNACNIMPVLSQTSTNKLYESGIRTVMADNICFPAKLMHGHINDLINRKVDRIFYPFVIYERKEDTHSRTSYNCPIVTAYSDVIKSSMDPAENNYIPLDEPVITFNDEKLLRKSCKEYLKSLKIDDKTIRLALDKAISAQKEYNNRLSERAYDILQQSKKQNSMVIVLAGRPYHVDPLIQHKISQSIAEMGIDVITENISLYAGEGVYKELLAVPQWAYPNRIFKAAHLVANCDKNVQFVQLTSFGCGPDAFILDEVNSILRRHGKNLTVLKIDDVNNIGSLRLRIRSLVESLQISGQLTTNIPFKSTKVFEIEDAERTIIAPYFAEGYSEFIPSIFKLMGYKFVNLPSGNQEDAEVGLKYANNEVCYPATIVVGSIINYLKTAKYDDDKIAIGISQTGGQCRASNYLALIKSAMISADYSHIPVVSVAFGDDSSNEQPGFILPWGKVIYVALYTMFYADCISKLYHASVVRENQEGRALFLKNKYTQESLPLIETRNMRGLVKLLKNAVSDFTASISKKDLPIIGIVGEIYLKYNAFSHKHIIDWLEKQNIEVAVPSIYNFLLCGFANNHVYKNNNIKKPALSLFLSDALYSIVLNVARKFDSICSDFPYYRKFSNLLEDLKLSSNIVNPAVNFGEGWLLPAEIANFAENKINSVISLQPFGCIANHIISKGVEKRIKKLYPNMNFLFLDFDSGVSEANIFNRLHFIVNNSINSLK